MVDRKAFVIAKAGKPLVKVAGLDAPAAPKRLGFLAGEITVPKDFDRMGKAKIAAWFGTRSGSGRPAIPPASPRRRGNS